MGVFSLNHDTTTSYRLGRTPFFLKKHHVTHSQWIFRNISLHDKINDYPHKKKSEEIGLKLESLAGIAPEDVPAESRFLLEINFSDLTKSHMESQKYWILTRCQS